MYNNADGLVAYFSSQVKAILAQYENINDLLGPTNDWTHPGTHCEVLLRDFLRRHLLPRYGVDKGFVFGRADTSTEPSHGCEIDILVHDQFEFQPVYRLNDFVIVLPASVRAIIQVKRTFEPRKLTVSPRKKKGVTVDGGSLAKGLYQVTSAKQHLFDLLVAQKQRHADNQHRQISQSDYPPLAFSSVTSALIAFDDTLGEKKDTKLKQMCDRMKHEYARSHAANGNKYQNCPYDVSLACLPNFVCSLKSIELSAADSMQTRFRDYRSHICSENGTFSSLQMLLWHFGESLAVAGARPTIAVPPQRQSGLIRFENGKMQYHDNC